MRLHARNGNIYYLNNEYIGMRNNQNKTYIVWSKVICQHICGIKNKQLFCHRALYERISNLYRI